ncbi:hypothetical protein CE91St54_07640 [Hungatella hathewayi]|uniref:Transferrin-like domain-containing protein n=1 Tax=Hungatella hathewayi TaxID=154046 RepID=A0AA37JD55_9FIRM|nr:hypothetical protein CE91St55_08150 [Hungatella hathewayi]GKH05656.1 hypothetical protein CE91St54_07640 [Hungatella hathewayi]
MIFQSSGMSMKKLCVNHCFVIDFIIPGICVHFVDFPLRKNKKDYNFMKVQFTRDYTG